MASTEIAATTVGHGAAGPLPERRGGARHCLVGVTRDMIAIDNFIEQGGERFARLPARRGPG